MVALTDHAVSDCLVGSAILALRRCANCTAPTVENGLSHQAT
jgi:hypothetical protein